MDRIMSEGCQIPWGQLETAGEKPLAPQTEEGSGGLLMGGLSNKRRPPECSFIEPKRSRYTWTTRCHELYRKFCRALEINEGNGWASVQRYPDRPISREDLSRITWRRESNYRLLDRVFGAIDNGSRVREVNAAYKSVWYKLVCFCDSHELGLDVDLYERLGSQLDKKIWASWSEHGLNQHASLIAAAGQTTAPAEAMLHDVETDFDLSTLGGAFPSNMPAEDGADVSERVRTDKGPERYEIKLRARATCAWTVDQRAELAVFGSELKVIPHSGTWFDFVNNYSMRPKSIDDIEGCEFLIDKNKEMLRGLYLMIDVSGVRDVSKNDRKNGLFNFVCYCDWHGLLANEETFRQICESKNQTMKNLAVRCRKKTFDSRPPSQTSSKPTRPPRRRSREPSRKRQEVPHNTVPWFLQPSPSTEGSSGTRETTHDPVPWLLGPSPSTEYMEESRETIESTAPLFLQPTPSVELAENRPDTTDGQALGAFSLSPTHEPYDVMSWPLPSSPSLEFLATANDHAFWSPPPSPSGEGAQQGSQGWYDVAANHFEF